MIVLFTDYGLHDPYVGQIKAMLAQHLPTCPVIDLLHSAPDFNPLAAAHLLAALAQRFPVGAVFLCVVDPGVGTPRGVVALQADGRWYVGPDNGLMSILLARANEGHVWRFQNTNEPLCATFHGRDVFAPIAIQIAAGGAIESEAERQANLHVSFDSGDLLHTIFIDHYGNIWTGIRGAYVDTSFMIEVQNKRIFWYRTFAEVEKGALFWYVNSAGLVEIAANRGSAAEILGMKIGDPIKWVRPPVARLH